MDLFDLFARIFLDSSEYEEGIESATKKGEGFGSKLKKAIGVGIKAIGAGLLAGATAAAKLTQSATQAYADYEQLVGGVETLFKNSSGLVQQYAADAYKTAGLSANEYMETVTSFSASLLQSLGGDTEQAAKVADMAISDMSDNANKMGSSMESIQAAYQGFAKGQYQLLDNLKLGYSGTKTEMERLLKDATALSGVEYDIDSLSDVYEAIHVIQDELGITGTTAKEASTTISGSIGMMKSAWQNLVAGLGDSNADMDKLFGDLVDSVETTFNNILPVAEKALTGIATVVEKLAPVIAEKLPGLVDRVLPPLLSAATTLVNALVENLPTIINVIIEVLPEIITSVTTALADASPQIVEAGILLTIALMNGLIQAIPVLVEKIPEIVKAVWETIKAHAPEMLQASNELINQLLIGIGNLLGKVADKGREILNKVKEGIMGAISSVVSVGMDIVRGIWQGISSGLGWIKSKITGWVGDVLGFFKRILKIGSPSKVFRDQVGKFMAQGIGQGFVDEMGNVERMMQDAMPEVSGLFDTDYPMEVTSVDYLPDGISGRGADSRLMEEILGLLRDIRDNMDADLVLSDGTLIGWMDKALGRRAMQRARGNA